jgi:(1->4)-alpha-D-glucan 1-alpha-D-glucosylmutase
MRLQQYSGPVDAKGMEDTAFYRYNRLIALNEVGGDPDRFGGTLAAFHRANLQRVQRWPHAMLAIATHDTKRGADARARLAALSEYAPEWRAQLPIWSRILRGPNAPSQAPDRPDRNDEYLLYQVLLGSWPCELLGGDAEDLDSGTSEALRAYAERVRATMTKSMREARAHTNWAFPNSEYEDAMSALIDAALTGNRAGAFLAAFLPFARALALTGIHNSLIQSVVQLTAPGVPDLYNGNELWDLSMVDPDNRRPVDYALRARLLEQITPHLQRDRAGCVAQLLRDWRTGGIKLALITTLLQHRRAHAALYDDGDYQAMPCAGPRADEICAYARTLQDAALIVAVARFPRRREQLDFDDTTTLSPPPALQRTHWRELLTGRTLTLASEGIAARALFQTLPVAVLVPTPTPAPAGPHTAHGAE